MKSAAGRTCLLFNPQAAGANRFADVRDRLVGAGVVIRELHPADDVKELARRYVDDGYDTVAVAGDDATVHAATYGLLDATRRAATLALFPLGALNDLGRAVGAPLDTLAAFQAMNDAKAREIDVARIDDGGRGDVMIGAATGGVSGRVAEDVGAELKEEWGPLAHLFGTVGPPDDLPVYRVTLRFDDGDYEQYDVVNVVVANTPTAAGGVAVAPAAVPDDGLLDVVLVHAGKDFDLTVVAARLVEGDYTTDPNVTHRRAARVELASVPPLPMTVDGEHVEYVRATFTAQPKRLRVLGGPGYETLPLVEPSAELEDKPGVVARVATRHTLAWGVVVFAALALAAVMYRLFLREVVGDAWLG